MGGEVFHRCVASWSDGQDSVELAACFASVCFALLVEAFVAAVFCLGGHVVTAFWVCLGSAICSEVKEFGQSEVVDCAREVGVSQRMK